jgi:hypothetical protein
MSYEAGTLLAKFYTQMADAFLYFAVTHLS